MTPQADRGMSRHQRPHKDWLKGADGDLARGFCNQCGAEKYFTSTVAREAIPYFGAIAFEYGADGRHIKVHGPFSGEPEPVRTTSTLVRLLLVRDGSSLKACLASSRNTRLD
jgi:hypothetical protein